MTEKIKSDRQGWYVFYNEAVDPKCFWENQETNSGLLLTQCPTCGTKQTRATYLKGFLKNFYTLVQGLSITAVAQCHCGQWLRVGD